MEVRTLICGVHVLKQKELDVTLTEKGIKRVCHTAGLKGSDNIRMIYCIYCILFEAQKLYNAEETSAS